jgi:hypothetical protein
LLHKKTIFYFISAKIGIFCEASTKNMLQKLNNQILENIIPYYAQFTSCLHGKSFIATHKKRQNSTNSAGSGQI